MVQWDKVRLKDREAEGQFTFQAALHRNGTIVFNYRDVSYGFMVFFSFTFDVFTFLSLFIIIDVFFMFTL